MNTNCPALAEERCPIVSACTVPRGGRRTRSTTGVRKTRRPPTPSPPPPAASRTRGARGSHGVAAQGNVAARRANGRPGCGRGFELHETNSMPRSTASREHRRTMMTRCHPRNRTRENRHGPHLGPRHGHKNPRASRGAGPPGGDVWWRGRSRRLDGQQTPARRHGSDLGGVDGSTQCTTSWARGTRRAMVGPGPANSAAGGLACKFPARYSMAIRTALDRRRVARGPASAQLRGGPGENWKSTQAPRLCHRRAVLDRGDVLLGDQVSVPSISGGVQQAGARRGRVVAG